MALAASMVLVTGAVIWRGAHHPDSGTAPVRIDVQIAPAPNEVATDFLPLLYSNVPTSASRIVRVEVPRNALASFGLASFDHEPRQPSETVTADLIVGDDGLARAVRFVRAIPPQER